jgi:CHAD domain-containing protein
MISFAKYYRKQVSRITENLSELIENYDEKTVHNLRVAYKKIRAMNNFIAGEFKSNKDIRDQIKILDTFYRNAGTIREIQLSKKLLESYRVRLDKSFDEFFEFLDTRLTESKSVLTDQVKGFDIDAIKRYKSSMYLLLKKADERKLLVKALKFIKKRVKIIESQVLKIKDKGRYHKIRTNTKEEYFFLQLLFSRNECRKRNFNLNHLKDLGVKLGKWHDVEILREYIHSFTMTKYPTGQVEPNLDYSLLMNYIDGRQKKALKKMDGEIIKSNRELINFLEITELSLKKK